MAAKAAAGWICSAGSSGSVSSLCRIWCVRALSQYAVARPVEQQIIDRRVGFNHNNYRSIANGCWHITSARVYCKCGCPMYRHIHEEMAPDYFSKFTGKTRPCAQTIISISVTISISASWFVGELSIRQHQRPISEKQCFYVLDGSLAIRLLIYLIVILTLNLTQTLS